MRDDELLAIYGATRQLAEDMQARDAELKQSTAALEATIAQVRQLPAMLGQQTSKYIAAGIREVVQEDFKDRVRPDPGSGVCSGSLRVVLLLHPAGVGVE
jgi:hypothetical protein